MVPYVHGRKKIQASHFHVVFNLILDKREYSSKDHTN